MPHPSGDHLPVRTKLVYATGDHTVNLVLSAASLLYFLFLSEKAGLSPSLAGLVVLAARVVDAVTDPAMGRLSDRTRWKVGRRRGYFLIGAIPFGLFFAAMWVVVPFESQLARFAYYTSVYVGVSLFTTCLSVPYLALIPEMATDYDERTSLNTYRAAAAVLGTFAAIAMNALVLRLGDDATAWLAAGIGFGVWLVIPWIGVFRVSFERPDFQKESTVGFLEGARHLIDHPAYRSLTAFYILARIAVDLVGLMLKIFFVYWIGRPDDFNLTMAIFLSVVVMSLPVWLRIARRHDKRTIFIFGAIWWALAQSIFYLADPDWPRWVLFTAAPLAAFGYAVADLMPWAMLGEVVDEDELRTGERREGVYVGFFTFLRKLGGAGAVALVGFALEAVGYSGGLPPDQQPAQAIEAIRLMTSFLPGVFLLLAVWVAMSYPLSRARHQQILSELRLRNQQAD